MSNKPALFSLPAFVRIVLLCLFAGLFSACSGGGGDSPSNNNPQPPAATTGTLAVSVSGLPHGTAATLRLTGPGNYSLALTQTQTVTALVPGTYTVTAQPVVVGSQTWVPTPPTRDVAVAAGANATASVAYAVNSTTLTLASFASGLSAPVFLAAPPGDTRQFIVERAGRILIMSNGALLARAFLDIRPSVSTAGEGGLLSLAFDPAYATNGRFYVYRTNLAGDIVIERYTVSSNADVADAASALTIIQIAHPTYQNHVGGLVAFGPDGYLYLGTGDGGGGGDPNGNAQNLNSLLGKMLRLDVSAASVTEPYRIPATNPYVNAKGNRGEIWAYGLRNPWRYTFDAGQLYIADVGQDAREEIDLEAATAAGLNYGWPRMEGTTCYLAANCDRTGLTLPVLDYAHTTAANSPCSITGGFVYRGNAMPELAGRYFYSDYCAGFIRSFYADGKTIYEQRDWNLANVGRVVSFGRDGQGELYVLTDSGAIWKLVKAN